MANDDNRCIVEKYICHKLLKRGYAWDFENAEEDADNNGSMISPPPGLARRCHGANNARPGSVPHLSKRLSQTDPHAAIHRVLREAGDELERLYQPDFAEMSHQLYLTSSMAERRFREVIDELFRDGVNWGRIVAFFEFGGTICVECVNKEMTSQVDHIAGWMAEYLNGPLHNWIQENGGWDNDPKHTSRLCKGYLTKKESDGMLHQMTWPPQSPDLNPIEMVCDELDRRVKEKQPTSAEHMWELLQDC
uniref:Apoptosis regulator Bcl-2 family BH4 domain-containing protein n=1 Tax=Oncorhynchus tshawytscha TaxID=74940 RepID=A0AAZ3PCK6_ONCTS